MMDNLNQGKVEAQRVAYLNGLYSQAVGGNLDAGEELSKIAMGGFQLARDLVMQMDEKLANPVRVVTGEVQKENL